MKIVTWNINSIRARLAHLVSWLRETQPEIVLLQEIKTAPETFPYEPIEDEGYNIAVYGQKSYNGVAILSKSPLEDIQKGIPHFGDPQARYIEAITAGIRVASVYVPNGQSVGSEKFLYKMDFLNHFHQHLQNLLTYDEAIIIGGDYNITADDFDVYNPEAWHEEVLCSTPERQALHRLLHLGYTDSIRRLIPNTPTYTWWDYRQASFPKNHGLRIDHLLTSPLATDKLMTAGVDTNMRALSLPSDHAPTWVTLDV